MMEGCQVGGQQELEGSSDAPGQTWVMGFPSAVYQADRRIHPNHGQLALKNQDRKNCESVNSTSTCFCEKL
jgi:hypothetical protein